MQHSSKTRTWANDDILPAAAASTDPAVVRTQDASQDKPTRPVKKSKVVKTETLSQATKKPADTNGDDGSQPEKGDKNEDGSAEEDDQPKSDMDWLRSKTSRLLGLLDEEEQAESNSRPAAPSNNTVEPIEEEDSDEAEETPAAEMPVAEEPVEESDYDVDVELIRISGRLFLRNLAYDATEADLETVFAPFGKIDEVSYIFHFADKIKIAARMMIILIGTSDMQCIRDVNRKSILVDAS